MCGYQEAFEHWKSTREEQCKRNRSATYHAHFDSVENIRHRELWNFSASRCEQEHWQKRTMKTAGSRARLGEGSSSFEPSLFSRSCAAPAGSECDTDSPCRWDIRCLRSSSCCTEADPGPCPGERQPSCHPRWWQCPWTDLKAQFHTAAFGKGFRNEPKVRSQINVRGRNALTAHFIGENVYVLVSIDSSFELVHHMTSLNWALGEERRLGLADLGEYFTMLTYKNFHDITILSSVYRECC